MSGAVTDARPPAIHAGVPGGQTSEVSGRGVTGELAAAVEDLATLAVLPAITRAKLTLPLLLDDEEEDEDDDDEEDADELEGVEVCAEEEAGSIHEAAWKPKPIPRPRAKPNESDGVTDEDDDDTSSTHVAPDTMIEETEADADGDVRVETAAADAPIAAETAPTAVARRSLSLPSFFLLSFSEA
jgi:hypothetical protein